MRTRPVEEKRDRDAWKRMLRRVKQVEVPSGRLIRSSNSNSSRVTMSSAINNKTSSSSSMRSMILLLLLCSSLMSSSTTLALVMVKTPPPQPTLAFLTFDLDDTLFPVAQVVVDANTAMMQAMWDAGYPDATNDSIVHHTKSVRRKKKKQMTYTTLRKKAIGMEMDKCSPPGKAVDYDLVMTVYDAWLSARHQSAEDHLFEGCLEMFETLKKKYPDVCIAAITNGRGNPLDMPDTLEPYFEFCVSGEDTDVFPDRKPHRGIYNVALKRYHEQYAGGDKKISETGHVWCHVGDCLANDVGGSTKVGAYTVWTELDDLANLEGATAASQLNGGPQPAWSTAPAKETNSRKKLANAAQKSVTEKITTLSQLPDALESILNKAYRKSLIPTYRR